MADAAGKWFAKTLLLLSHPEAEYEHPAIDAAAVRFQLNETPAPRYFSWLIDGSAPPIGLSVWVYRADLSKSEPPLHKMPLPRVRADGDIYELVSFEVGLHGLCVTLVVHYGWPISHPLEISGAAVPLVPAPGEAVDFGQLPELWPRSVSWTRCLVDLKPGVFGSNFLPPLRASTELFRVLPEVLPFTDRWGG